MKIQQIAIFFFAAIKLLDQVFKANQADTCTHSSNTRVCR